MRDAAFRIFSNPAALPATHLRPVLAIGNFDGFHRGHKALAAAAKTEAAARSVPSGVLTFAPHSRTVLQPDRPFFALSSETDKALLLAASGLGMMVTIPFDAALMAMTPDAFAETLLARRLGVSGVVVGRDFRYGRGRAGDVARLTADGRRLGFTVTAVAPVAVGVESVSSTRIRESLSAGDVARAAQLLGHWWFVRAPVAHGDKRGRLLGYPTANLLLPATCGLALGIYAVRAAVRGQMLDGVASFGRRPTFDDGAPRLETFLFDFTGDIYGEELAVEFIERLRGEERFASVEALIAQMERDSAAARASLTAARGRPEIGSILPAVSKLSGKLSTAL